MRFTDYHPSAYPTQEDVLDVNFWSIVSDCRAIKAGTLVPRPWADISTTWNDKRDPEMFRSKETRQKQSESRKSFYASRVRPLNRKQVHLFRRMVSILVKNGTNVWDARMKARELLGLDGPIEIRR